ncbi:ribonucrease Y [Singulisphaera sp. GP187]|uniref:ribonuclease Y n=1 Tax=Singulisphaera sp. GP187 TaxID=1882752 RepID=UPI00092CD156|nr:ribonuclease Y [Singulisphaera sp. GP187]SIO62260.1 ribonucrease Y [Singulisphaera sp. GP187]
MYEATIGLIGIILGVAAGLSGALVVAQQRAKTARGGAEVILANARREAETIRKEADLQSKEEGLRRREAIDSETEVVRRGFREQDKRLEKRSDLLDQKLDLINKKERDFENVQRYLAEQQEELTRRNLEVKQTLTEQRDVLHRVSQLGPDEARALLLKRLDTEMRHEVGGVILKHEQTLRETCQQKAREVLATAIQRYAASHTAETTVSTVDIPSDDMKGRIIGREGRNIRAFEKATGVDVIVDDTPGIVIVTGFDNIRREIAKLSLEKLIMDGRIHPTRIEEIVKETQEEMEQHIRQLGQAAAQEANVPALHERLLDLLGRLKFRTSYSQNVLQHSIEVAYLTGLMAEEIGLDGALGRRCGLLHDIGKAADHEMEGGHPAIGAELTKRYGERPEVVHAALGHHDDLRPETPYTVLVAAADAVSASRPGARRETLDKYVRRLEDLEALACGFPGVEQAYAIQAGREIRVIADSHQLGDEAAAKLCRDIAKAVQQQLTYPGEVKVTVLRETRNVEFAR